MASYPIANGLCFLNGTYNGIATKVANITSIPGFPSTFAGASNANVMVNTAANAVTFVPSTQLFADLANQTFGQALAANANTEITWTNNFGGSLPTVPATGDVVITQTGTYFLTACVSYAAAAHGNLWAIGTSDGAGNLVATLCNVETAGQPQCYNLSTVANLNAGDSVGVFFVETLGNACTGASVGASNFRVKLIA